LVYNNFFQKNKWKTTANVNDLTNAIFDVLNICNRIRLSVKLYFAAPGVP